MAVDPDVVTTALQKLLPEYTETWTKWSPFIEEIAKSGNFKNIAEPYIEFVLVPEGPGQFTQINTGDEFIRGGRRTTGTRASEYTQRFVYAFDVPLKAYDEAQGAADIAKLLEKYPQRGTMDALEQLASQFVMGDVAALSGVPTLNGDALYSPGGNGARNGLLEFAAAADQTGVVHGVAKNSIVGWHNQYGHITSMQTDGLKTLRRVFNDCNEQSQQALGSPNLILADRLTYENYIDTLEDLIQFINHSADIKKGDAGNISLRDGIMFHSAKMYADNHIDVSGFTTADAQLGVAYILNTNYLHLLKRESGKGDSGFLKMRKPFRLPDQEVLRHEVSSDIGMYTTNLRSMGAVTGGNNE
jgi:hypothetical protein